MASVSSTSNENKNINRSDPSRMYNIGQTPLAQLRPEKLDDITIKNQIALIQEVCRDTDLDLIALVFHECDYNMQTAIERIRAGDFENGGWQKAKSNHKKKNHNMNNISDPMLNGGIHNDDERSLSQRTSSPPSLRNGTGGRHRQESYQHSSRTNVGRRGTDLGRNYFIPTNSRYPSRNYPNNNKSSSIQENPSETTATPKQKEEKTPTTTISSSSTDEFEFVGGTTQSLTFDNSLKTSSSSIKRPLPSSIPQQPVSMHPTVQFSTEPIDIQFGDVQWNDSVPMTTTPSNSSVLTKSLDNQQSFSFRTANNYQQQQQSDIGAQNDLPSNYINSQVTNETDRDLLEITNRLSTSSISSSLPITNITANNLEIVPLDGTSHLSDHLADSLQAQQVPIQMTSSSASLTHSTRLPPTSTPNSLDYISPTSQQNNPFIPNTLQPSLSNTSNSSGGNPSAFTPYNTPGTFQAIPRDYSQTAATWNQQPSNYKTNVKPTMIQPGNYSRQPPYQLPPQQQFIVGTYPYPTPTLYPVLTTSVEPWSTAGYDPYSTYPATNYLPTYPTQQQYHSATVQPTKYDQYSFDKDFLAHYGQTRLTNNEVSNSPQTTKDTPMPSKLSATAASFPQGSPLAATSPTAAFYINPVLYTVPTFYTSHQDRSMSYPSVDNRDNRNGGHNNRNHYHQQQQQQQQQHQRTHNNSTWHSHQ